MKITENRRKVVEELAAVQCDKCSRVVAVDDVLEHQEMLSVSFTGGYGAIMGDGESFAVDLCQHCVKDLLGPYLRCLSRDQEAPRPRSPKDKS